MPDREIVITWACICVLLAAVPFGVGGYFWSQMVKGQNLKNFVDANCTVNKAGGNEQPASRRQAGAGGGSTVNTYYCCTFAVAVMLRNDVHFNDSMSTRSCEPQSGWSPPPVCQDYYKILENLAGMPADSNATVVTFPCKYSSLSDSQLGCEATLPSCHVVTLPEFAQLQSYSATVSVLRPLWLFLFTLGSIMFCTGCFCIPMYMLHSILARRKAKERTASSAAI